MFFNYFHIFIYWKYFQNTWNINITFNFTFYILHWCCIYYFLFFYYYVFFNLLLYFFSFKHLIDHLTWTLNKVSITQFQSIIFNTEKYVFLQIFQYISLYGRTRSISCYSTEMPKPPFQMNTLPPFLTEI